MQEKEINHNQAHLNTFLQLKKIVKEIFGLEIEMQEFGNMMEITYDNYTKKDG